MTETKRERVLEWLRTSPETSVLVIGAGVNGIGTFRDLALQGVDVLMVDRSDFCSGTSAASSHMVHGGIRYLENGEFRLVREAVQERRLLLDAARHYVRPLPIVMPIFSWFSGMLNAPLKFLGLLDQPAERGALVIKAGLLLYDAYAGSDRNVPRHELLMKGESLKRFPKLNPNIRCSARYYDAAMESPERICVEMVQDAEDANAEARAANYISVVGAAGPNVELRDEATGETFTVAPRVVINASGPWIDVVNRKMDRRTNYIGGTKGSHLVLDHPELRDAIGENEIFFENDDGRIVLIFPLRDRVLIGTSDIPIEDPDEALCTDAEIDYFIRMVSRVFPEVNVDRSQIVYTFSGVRPLPKQDIASPGQISRDHSIEVQEPDGEVEFPILNLVGGKWTTFRAFAEEATDVALARLAHQRSVDTRTVAIGGGKSHPQNAVGKHAWIAGQANRGGISTERVRGLFDRYGTYAEQIVGHILSQEIQDEELHYFAGYSRHEIDFIVRNEMVVHLDDFIMRRSLLAMLGYLSGPALEELSQVIGASLGWSERKQQAEYERTRRTLARQHRVVLQEEEPQLAPLTAQKRFTD